MGDSDRTGPTRPLLGGRHRKSKETNISWKSQVGWQKKKNWEMKMGGGLGCKGTRVKKMKKEREYKLGCQLHWVEWKFGLWTFYFGFKSRFLVSKQKGSNIFKLNLNGIKKR
jgi:hypothetical protein